MRGDGSPRVGEGALNSIVRFETAVLEADVLQRRVREARNCECALPNSIQKVSMGILKGFSRIAAHSPLKVKESNSIFTTRFSSSSFSK